MGGGRDLNNIQATIWSEEGYTKLRSLRGKDLTGISPVRSGLIAILRSLPPDGYQDFFCIAENTLWNPASSPVKLSVPYFF